MLHRGMNHDCRGPRALLGLCSPSAHQVWLPLANTAVFHPWEPLLPETALPAALTQGGVARAGSSGQGFRWKMCPHPV